MAVMYAGSPEGQQSTVVLSALREHGRKGLLLTRLYRQVFSRCPLVTDLRLFRVGWAVATVMV
jgi:hypothetical protein